MTNLPAVLTVIAIYTWPVLFAWNVGLVVYVWQGRFFERAVMSVRAEFGTEQRSLHERLAQLERTVNGLDGRGGMHEDVRALRRQSRKVLVNMARIGEALKIELEPLDEGDD